MSSLIPVATKAKKSSAPPFGAPRANLTGSDREPRATKAPIGLSLRPLKTTPVFDTYWRFAVKRQDIFFRRLAGAEGPWTDDPVLVRHKFTNAYRALDRVSQYLIKHVIYRSDQSPEELFFRIMLFKQFNKTETWELLERALGGVRWKDYSFRRYDSALTRARAEGKRIYSAAYIMPSGVSSFGSSVKHRNHLKLLEKMMADDLPRRIRGASTMLRAFELIRAYPTVGDFLAYQYVTDLNYSTLTDFREDTFVVAGPGAKDGVRKCFSDTAGLNDGEVIRVVFENQSAQFQRLGLEFRTLWGRSLQLIDCQNLFCEVDKYARVVHPEFKGLSGRNRIKQVFQPKASIDKPWFPPKWAINEKVAEELL
jgi:hypothetical protein